MFRNEYDRDVSIWSPQGRIHQIEYAMEAVKQGSATVGLKSKTHAVILALKRSQSELTAHQKKLIKISPHIAISIAGLTADGRSLGNFMQTECMYFEYVYNGRIPVTRLINMVASKTQQPTMYSGSRPFGVGILLAGYDEKGPHIYQTCPSANFYNCKSMAIGSRSQSARTYLERQIDKFNDCELDELIRHGLLALRETLPSGQELSMKNVSIAVVGKGQDVTIYENEGVGKYINSIDIKKEQLSATGGPPQPSSMGEAQSSLVPPISAGQQQEDGSEEPMDM